MRMCRLNLSHRTLSRPQLAIKEHNGIVEAIENRDADLVEMLMRRHIDTAWKALEKIIGGDAMPEGELIPDKRVGSGLV